MPETKAPVKSRQKATPSNKASSKKALAAVIKGKYAWVPHSSEDCDQPFANVKDEVKMEFIRQGLGHFLVIFNRAFRDRLPVFLVYPDMSGHLPQSVL